MEDLNLVYERFVDQHGELQLLLDNQGGEVTDVEIVPAWNVECVTHQRTTRWPRLVGTIVFNHNPPPPKRPVPLVQFSFAIMYTDSAGQDWTKQYVVRIDRSHLNKSYVREEKEHKVMGRQRDHINQIIKPTRADSTETLPINDFQRGMQIAQALGASENEIASVYLQGKFLRGWISDPSKKLSSMDNEMQAAIVAFLRPLARWKMEVMGNSIYAHLFRKGFSPPEIAELTNIDLKVIRKNLSDAGYQI